MKLILSRKQHDQLMDHDNNLFKSMMDFKHTWHLGGLTFSNVDTQLAYAVKNALEQIETKNKIL